MTSQRRQDSGRQYEQEERSRASADGGGKGAGGDGTHRGTARGAGDEGREGSNGDEQDGRGGIGGDGGSGRSGGSRKESHGSATLLIVGSANADLVVGVERHPAPGETVLGASDLAVHTGGKGANQAVAAGRLGARVAFCGRVGRDAYGERVVAQLRESGVDTAALAVDGAAPTGVALITVAASGENTIVVAPGANAGLTADEVEAAIGPDVRVVSAQCEIPLAAVRAAARRAPRFVLNPSPPEALSGPEAAEVLARADPLVVNEHEMGVLLGEDGGREPADLLGLGVRSAVVTLGAAGAAVVGPGGRTTLLPAVPARVVDTTGAGDAFTGALAWRLAEGDDLVTAAGWAVRVGAAAVEERGAQLSSTACGKLLADSAPRPAPDPGHP